MRTIKVGVIGCGAISNAYFNGCKAFPILEVVHCADLDPARAAAKAAEHSIARHGHVEELLANPEVEIVVNLTIPRAHASVNLAAIEAGKHLYCEKPFAINREEAKPVLEAAASRGLLIGSAPDTFLGQAHQACRKLVDEGAIGEPFAAVAFMACPGHESWHPNPAFYYDIGGGPMFDMGPYYLTALVNLIGPMRRVSGSTKITFPERTITSEPLNGTRVAVKVPTHYAGTVEFESGAIATVLMSFDICSHNLPRLELYGTEGTLAVPDPNCVDGEILLRRREHREWRNMPPTHTPVPHRGAAVADIAFAINGQRSPRTSAEMAFHVVDAMQAFEESSRLGRHIQLQSTCQRPTAVPPGLAPGVI